MKFASAVAFFPRNVLELRLVPERSTTVSKSPSLGVACLLWTLSTPTSNHYGLLCVIDTVSLPCRL